MIQYDLLDTKERILYTARELFVKNGYSDTSIRDIAAASETNIAHVKYYFDSKYNLFKVIFEEAFDVLVTRIFSAMNSGLPLFDLIESWIDAYYEVLIKYPQIPIFVLNEITRGPDTLIEKMKMVDPYGFFLRLDKAIADEVAKGTIKNTSTIDLAINIISLSVFPFVMREIVTTFTSSSADEYKELLENHKIFVKNFVLNAIKA